jgi:hypothetical protein
MGVVETLLFRNNADHPVLAWKASSRYCLFIYLAAVSLVHHLITSSSINSVKEYIQKLPSMTADGSVPPAVSFYFCWLSHFPFLVPRSILHVYSSYYFKNVLVSKIIQVVHEKYNVLYVTDSFFITYIFQFMPQ